MTHPGMFIVFEGVDRCGKTTQSDILTRKLDAVKFTFPDRTTETGRIIHKYLNHEIELDDVAVHLLFAANRWERAKIIRDLIAIGKNVVLDRYSFSGVAYSVAKMRPELDITRCWASEIHLPAPDIIFYLHGDESDIISRAEFGTERYERADF
jgi:dTMP kinase